ncbi:MAG: glycosyltransferase [Oscillospiraceae bacterium]|nr:glycosyltransferase [Oscillospiraceae bacterium]
MNILLVTRGYPQAHNNNMGIFERDQAIALVKAGHRVAYGVVDIRSIRRKRKFGYNHFTDENGIEVFEMNWPIGPMPRNLIEYFRQEALMSLYPHVLEDFGRPDIIHSHFLNYGVISVKLSKKEDIPLVVTEHSSYMNKTSLPWWVKKRAVKTYSACDSVIAVSTPLATNIKKATGFDCRVVHNIANISDNIEVLRKKPEIKNILFVSAGNLLPGKGFDILLRSFAEAKSKVNNMSLLILGDGPERKKLKALTSELNISDCVTFYGKYRKENLPELCKDANAFVLASRYETFGVVYIEAMAMGLPVIATRCGGPEDFVDDSNGFLVDVEDTNDLARAIEEMSVRWEEFDRDKIASFAKEHFSPEVIAADISAVYRDVWDKRNSR